MVPMLDMLRYHLSTTRNVWRDEFGTAEDPDDFEALRRYSPYHQVRDGVAYPATMFVSGDADRNCNPLHARKMTARLQAANAPSIRYFSTTADSVAFPGASFERTNRSIDRPDGFSL